jgi:hypothetical protein
MSNITKFMTKIKEIEYNDNYNLLSKIKFTKDNKVLVKVYNINKNTIEFI